MGLAKQDFKTLIRSAAAPAGTNRETNRGERLLSHWRAQARQLLRPATVPRTHQPR